MADFYKDKQNEHCVDRKCFLLISIVTYVKEILNEVFILLEQHLEVLVSLWLSIGQLERNAKLNK